MRIIDQIKQQSEQARPVIEKARQVAQRQLGLVSREGVRVLEEVGINLNERDLNKLLLDVRERNGSLRGFITNLEVATYDLRSQARWNATMAAAFARVQAEKRLERLNSQVIEPRLTEVRGRVEKQVEALKGRVRRKEAEAA
jgi:hypothetical protein